MSEHDVQRFARTLAEVAHALEHVNNVPYRIARVLELTRVLVPYARIALLEAEESGRRLHVVPPADAAVTAVLHASLERALRALTDDAEVSDRDRAPTSSLTLPTIGADRINGILHVTPDAGEPYAATHLRLLAVVAAQLGAYLTMVRLRAEHASHAAELAAAVEFQQVLAGIVGHDLRSPLAVITTVASMLRDKVSDASQIRALDSALHSARRASRLISDLIDVTECRVQGSMSIHRHRIDARAVVEATVQEVRLAHPGRSIAFDHSGDQGSVFGDWDPDRLGELLVNLVNNAVSHGARDGAVRVRMAHDHETLALSVHNTGAPIPATVLRTMFDPFKRGVDRETTRVQGLGLGLYIVDQIIKAHAGTVSVTSDLEAGTTFTVRLPREPGRNEAR